MDNINSALIKMAVNARKNAYAPYSNFFVGAALLCKDGKIFTGCNVENAAYTPSNCAERTAVFKAVSEGCRNFTSIAVVGGLEDEKNENANNAGKNNFVFPCGVCRQVLAEFCDISNFRILVAPLNNLDDIAEFTLETLFPRDFSFGAKNLKI